MPKFILYETMMDHNQKITESGTCIFVFGIIALESFEIKLKLNLKNVWKQKICYYKQKITGLSVLL